MTTNLSQAIVAASKQHQDAYQFEHTKSEIWWAFVHQRNAAQGERDDAANEHDNALEAFVVAPYRAKCCSLPRTATLPPWITLPPTLLHSPNSTRCTAASAASSSSRTVPTTRRQTANTKRLWRRKTLPPRSSIAWTRLCAM